ncbi:hypothetical protein RvY_06189, partial [Ramazzottius varieornatus]
FQTRFFTIGPGKFVLELGRRYSYRKARDAIKNKNRDICFNTTVCNRQRSPLPADSAKLSHLSATQYLTLMPRLDELS